MNDAHAKIEARLEARRAATAAARDAQLAGTAQSTIVAYIAKLEEMTQVQLMDELESCVRQNQYGSHDAQTRLVRAELGQRCSH